MSISPSVTAGAAFERSNHTDRQDQLQGGPAQGTTSDRLDDIDA